MNALARKVLPTDRLPQGRLCARVHALRNVAADCSFASEAGKLPAGAAAAVVGSRLLVVERARE